MSGDSSASGAETSALQFGRCKLAFTAAGSGGGTPTLARTKCIVKRVRFAQLVRVPVTDPLQKMGDLCDPTTDPATDPL